MAGQFADYATIPSGAQFRSARIAAAGQTCWSRRVQPTATSFRVMPSRSLCSPTAAPRVLVALCRHGAQDQNLVPHMSGDGGADADVRVFTALGVLDHARHARSEPKQSKKDKTKKREANRLGDRVPAGST
jgi:hypothetical protein